MVSPAEAAINVNLKEQIAYVLHTLTPREEKIMKMRFGLEDGSEHTLEEVGRSFAVTRERIRQIEAKALCKLRHPSRSHKLKAFFSTTCMNDAQNLHTGEESRGTRGQPANPLSRSLLNNM